MQATSLQEKMNTDHFYSDKEISEEFYKRLKSMEISRRDLDLKLQQCKIAENSDEEEDEDDVDVEEEEDDDDHEEEEEEEEFSFGSVGEDAAVIAAEDAFSNGQIKAVFPLFDQSLLFSGGEDGGSDYLPENLPMRPPVKVFVETKEEIGGGAASSSSPAIAGPYCDWSSRQAVEASPESCKKSNSTGFSKLWRLKEITCRSNSDGRDAFVFLNGSHAPPRPPPPPQAAEKKEPAVKASGKVKKSVKGKTTAAMSAHEVYLKSKAKEEERRRSYMPYRPGLMGLFTNVNGGLTRNVHPF